jgi:pyruvate kinase
VQNSIVKEYHDLSAGESLGSSAVKTAIDIDAKLIVIMSKNGKMGSYVSKFRPGVSALMLTPDLTVARQASGIMLGMHTIQVDSLEKWEELVEETSYELVSSGMMNVGDKIVVISGKMGGMRERLFITELKEGKSHGHFVKGGGLFFNRGLMLSFGMY